MSNIYLKVIIEKKNWRSQNIHFPSFEKFVCRSVFGEPTHEDIDF